jgi:hypothetical protein
MAILNLNGLRRVIIHDGLDTIAGGPTIHMSADMEASLVPARVLILRRVAYGRHSDSPAHDVLRDTLNYAH